MILTNVGYSNYIQISKIVLIADADTNPMKRVIAKAKEEGTYFDVTHGKKTLSVIITESGQVIGSPVDKRSMKKRIEEGA
ncbi:DUF370 domain-containing protein [Clostridium isatidis]|uniref:DUF370 domain-containing protein n=1 Tax=Clostridium isatidis TaxID=182773 RepID=UPI003AAD73DF